jgi:hypothetical protein
MQVSVRTGTVAIYLIPKFTHAVCMDFTLDAIETRLNMLENSREIADGIQNANSNSSKRVLAEASNT